MFSRDSASLWVQIFVLIGLGCLVIMFASQQRELRSLQTALVSPPIEVAPSSSTPVVSSTAATTSSGQATATQPRPAAESGIRCGSPSALLGEAVTASLDRELVASGFIPSKDARSIYACVKNASPSGTVLVVSNDCTDPENGACNFETLFSFDPATKVLAAITTEPTSEMLSPGIVINRIDTWAENEIRYRVAEAISDGGCTEASLRQPWFIEKRINTQTHQETTLRTCYQKSCAAAEAGSSDLRCE